MPSTRRKCSAPPFRRALEIDRNRELANVCSLANLVSPPCAIDKHKADPVGEKKDTKVDALVTPTQFRR